MSSNSSMCTTRELMQVNITPYLFKSLRPSLAINGPKQSIPQCVNGGVDSDSFYGEVSHLLTFSWSPLTSTSHTFMDVWGYYGLRPRTHSPLERISFIVIPFPWCLTFVLKWAIIRSVTWEPLSKMTGCFNSNGKLDFSSLPQTRSKARSSRKGSNFRRGLFFMSLQFPPWLLILVISSSKAVRCTSLKISISVSCRSATDVITVFGLFLFETLFRYETTPTALAQSENLVIQTTRLNEPLVVVTRTVDLTSGSWLPNLNDKNSFFTKWNFLVPQKCWSTEPIRFR